MQLEQLKIKGPNRNFPKKKQICMFLHLNSAGTRGCIPLPSANAEAEAAALSPLQMQRQRLQPCKVREEQLFPYKLTTGGRVIRKGEQRGKFEKQR